MCLYESRQQVCNFPSRTVPTRCTIITISTKQLESCMSTDRSRKKLNPVPLHRPECWKRQEPMHKSLMSMLRWRAVSWAAFATS